jgi:hypothetical protein
MKPHLVTSSQWYKFNLYFLIEHFIGKTLSEKFIRPKRNKLYAEALQNPGMKERGRTIDVKEIEHYSLEPLLGDRDALLKKPLVFRGVAKDWPAVKNWSKQFFRQHYDKTPVTIIDNPGLVDKDKENVFTKTTFGEYFDEVEKDPSKYLRFSRVLDHNPVLLEDLDLEWLRKFKSGFNMGEQTFLFMGEGDTRTPMHAGLTHTIFIQIKGRKKWTICLPNERFFVDPIADRVLYFYTDANPTENAPYDPKFPLTPYLEKYEFVLEEGDVLWLPSLFWHYIDNLTPTIGVAFKYTNIPQSFKITKLFTTLFFMATKPTILRSFLYNRTKGQDYVFNSKSAKYQ